MNNTNQMRKLLNVLTESNVLPKNEIDATRDEALNTIKTIMHELVSEFSHYSSDEVRNNKSAPNTSTFTSQSHSMIDVKTNFYVPGGRYEFSRTYDVFIQIGADIPLDIKNKIKQSFYDDIHHAFDISFTKFKFLTTTDNKRLIYDDIDGSSWGGFGIFTSK